MVTWHQLGGAAVAVLIFSAATASAQDGYSHDGYTYYAPSVYLTPPVVVYDPAFVVPVRTAIVPGPTYLPPARVVYAEPAFVSQTVVPYNPVWNYGPALGPSAYRERGHVHRRGMDYKYQAYVPGRAAPVYSYQVDAGRNKVKIRERYR